VEGIARNVTCFPASTLVRTRHGLVSIEKVTVGEDVLSQNPNSGKLEYKKVIRLAKPHPDKLLRIRIAGGMQSIEATADHRFFIELAGENAGNWVATSKIKPGDLVLGRKGTWTKVIAVSPVENEQTVYNFEVEDNHDYFVGVAGILVHNGLCDIAAKYPIDSGNCFDCAIEMQNAIAETGAESQPIWVVNPDGPIYSGDNVISAFEGEDGGIQGFHVGVESDGLAYDAANHNGVPVGEWGPFTNGSGSPLTPGTSSFFP
jgi:hypothetical protein